MEQTPPVKAYLLPCSVSLGSAVSRCVAGLGGPCAGAERELCGTPQEEKPAQGPVGKRFHLCVWLGAGSERCILCVPCPMDLDTKPSSPQGWERRPWKCFSGSQFPLRERSMGME